MSDLIAHDDLHDLTENTKLETDKKAHMFDEGRAIFAQNYKIRAPIIHMLNEPKETLAARHVRAITFA